MTHFPAVVVLEPEPGLVSPELVSEPETPWLRSETETDSKFGFCCSVVKPLQFVLELSWAWTGSEAEAFPEVLPRRSLGSFQTGLASDLAIRVLAGEMNYSPMDLASDYLASLALVDLDQEFVLEMTELPSDFASLAETLNLKA